MLLSSLRHARVRRRAVGATAALATALLPAVVLATPAHAAPLPATYTATASGDILTVKSTVAGAPIAEVDLVHSTASANSASATGPASATSANVGVSAGALAGVAIANTETAPSSHAQSGTLVAATLPGVLSSGVITYTDTVNWAGALGCVPAATPISESVTETAGATATLLGAEVVDTGAATTTATTSLGALSPTNDTRSVNATATANIAGLSLLNGLVTLSALQPSLTAVATSGPATSATLAAADVTVTGPAGTQTLTAGGSVTAAVPLVGSVTLTMASNASVVANGAGSFSTNLITAEVTLLGATGTVTLQLLPLSVSAVAPAGGVECAAPAITITTPADGATTTDATPTISGTSNVPNGTVTVTIDGESHTTTTDAGGSWTLGWPTPLAHGSQTVTASVTKDGSTSTDSTTFTLAAPMPTVDITTPTAGSTTADVTPSISGTSNVISGTITLVIDGGAPITIPTDATGSWTHTPGTALAEGHHAVTATATTPSGTATDTTNFIIDVPPAVAITAPADGSTTKDQTPTISGTSSVVNGTVTISLDGGAPMEVATGADGDWSHTPTTPLDNGTHEVVATATDPQGDTVNHTVEFEVLIEGPLPEVEITSPEDGSTTTARSPVITGTSAVLNGSILVVVNRDEQNPYEVSTDAEGDWSLTPGTSLPCGENSVVAIAENELGFTAVESVFTVSCQAASAIPGSSGSPGSPGSLARTGADVGTTLAGGLLLLAAGVGLIRRFQGMRP